MKSKIREHILFPQRFYFKVVRKHKDSLIFAVIEEGTPNTSMITTINTFKTIVQSGKKGMIKTDLIG